MIANDLTMSAKYLNKAAETKDPLERMKLMVANYIAPQFINPTLI
jgi:hypothetical protein